MKESQNQRKKLGTAAYKKRDFETAIHHYSWAIEMDNEDISYITNRAAIYLQMEKVLIFYIRYSLSHLLSVKVIVIMIINFGLLWLIQ